MRHFINMGEHVIAESKGSAEAVRPPQIKGRYAAITLAELCSGKWDAVFSPKARLYLYLDIISVRGAREVHMTAAACEAIRVTRDLKSRYLHQLESEGVIAIRRDPGRAPWITILKLTG